MSEEEYFKEYQMFTIPSLITIILLIFIGLIGSNAKKNPQIQAVAYLKGPPNSNNISPTGNVTFIQNGRSVKVRVFITGLTPGKHGFHVHEKGDLSNGCASMGGHYNPEKVTHGARNDKIRHVGDLGNVKANKDGIVDTTFTDRLISLTDPRSIIGRGVVVHEKVDDLGKGTSPESKKTGNAGGRVACGVIQKFQSLKDIQQFRQEH
uniref:Superoxide dismutase [Cu-Zn] n=1 Tax=Glossina brevipalpis TaxID=37001 RepID=A0A1A9WP46_9MUSC